MSAPGVKTERQNGLPVTQLVGLDSEWPPQLAFE